MCLNLIVNGHRYSFRSLKCPVSHRRLCALALCLLNQTCHCGLIDIIYISFLKNVVDFALPLFVKYLEVLQKFGFPVQFWIVVPSYKFMFNFFYIFYLDSL